MNLRNRILAAFTVAGILAMSQVVIAQGPPAAGPQDRYDERTWNAPRGYNDYYQENGNPNMAARQGLCGRICAGGVRLS